MTSGLEAFIEKTKLWKSFCRQMSANSMAASTCRHSATAAAPHG
jgi:ribosomal protein L40E